MVHYTVEIPLLKLKKSKLIEYFDEKETSCIRLYVCDECKTVVLRKTELGSHLEKHPKIWRQYLVELAEVLKPKIPEANTIESLKLVTEVIDEKTDEQISLRMPRSRIERNFENLQVSEHLQGFHSRLQKEYNSCPVGQYAGPYDQNECLSLDIQLPGTDMNFEKYTSFVHPDDVNCNEFSITDSYNEKNDLAKIDSLTTGQNSQSDTGDQTFYTCQAKGCKIPCICSVCNGHDQCEQHKIKHDELFDIESDTVLCRSKEEFCQDQTFFEKSYLMKYPGIPIQCITCKKDFLHHISYHFTLHELCKFCMNIRFKTYATSIEEFKDDIKRHEYHMKCVCPYCDNTFCEPHIRKKHIQFEHENVNKFSCNSCTKTFHSKQALEYHYSSLHLEKPKSENCSICGMQFSAKVNLLQHVKYVHSEEKQYSCPDCDSKFKRKTDMRAHVLNIHGSSMTKELYGNIEYQELNKCDICDKTYQYKKNLNEHMKNIHDTTNGPSTSKTYKCNQCDTSFTLLRNLTAHTKSKHSRTTNEFPCTTCGKVFNQKRNLTRHEKIHKTE